MTDKQYGDNVWHNFGGLQHLKSRLGLPCRALCGTQLKLDEDAPYPTADAPQCPGCVEVAG